MAKWWPFEYRKHRTGINETQFSNDDDATLCIAAANTTLKCNHHVEAGFMAGHLCQDD